MPAMLSATKQAFLLVFLLLTESHGTVCLDVDVESFTNSLFATADDTLHYSSVQTYFDGLQYTPQTRVANALAQTLAQQTARLFGSQMDALREIKQEVEYLYNNRQFTRREIVKECCRLAEESLSPNYEFTVPISKEHSCDRISKVAQNSSEFIQGKLDSIYMRNDAPPLKWQYFGSERGVLNQFPAGRTQHCGDFDDRFRPWYRVAATPEPKDVVIVVKSSQFLPTKGRRVLFKAAKIILHTLNPRDRVAVVIYNDHVYKPVIEGCYATTLSLATPANLRKLDNFIETSPEPLSGNNMIEALTVAYQYFTDHNPQSDRSRAVVLFTDDERLESRSREAEVMSLIENHGNGTTLFVYAVTEHESTSTEVFNFLSGLGGSFEEISANKEGDLRQKVAKVYSKFSEQQQGSGFNPIYLPPYYDVFGLDQLVLTLSTPCYSANGQELIGVAAVDLTLADTLSGVEYFRGGEFSYAFVVDKDGLVIYHPLLPLPSSTDSAVYLDISTLEPHPGFQYVRESMISGGSNCVQLNSTHVFSRGSAAYDGARPVSVTSDYCWAQIADTPFSLCVVIPVDSSPLQPNHSSFSPPISAHYHRLDVLASRQQLCSRNDLTVTKDYSTVALSPDAFARPDKYIFENETTATVQYLQGALESLDDSRNTLARGVLESVAATAIVDTVWDNTDTTNQHVTWRYIATGNGVLRLYPGVQLNFKEFSVPQRPWYQRAVALLGLLILTPPYQDGLGAGKIVTLSKAILPQDCKGSLHGASAGDPSCSVLAVMGVDLTLGYLTRLLEDAIPLCNMNKGNRCILIDSNGYVISHPAFVEGSSHNASAPHLAQMEPFVASNMVRMGFLEETYCNNFQYNENYTKRPRKQKSYSITEMVAKATEPLDGGCSTCCVFYKVAPIAGTNAFLIVVDEKRSSQLLCPPLACSCDPDRSCGRLPGDCVCPCYEVIPDSLYNACLEAFAELSAPACPTHFGLDRVNFSLVDVTRDPSLSRCFQSDCTRWQNHWECESAVGCRFCAYSQANGSVLTACDQSCPQPPAPRPSPTATPTNTGVATWQAVAGVFMAIAVVAVVSIPLVFLCSRRNFSHCKQPSEHHSRNPVYKMGSISSSASKDMTTPTAMEDAANSKKSPTSPPAESESGFSSGSSHTLVTMVPSGRGSCSVTSDYHTDASLHGDDGDRQPPVALHTGHAGTDQEHSLHGDHLSPIPEGEADADSLFDSDTLFRMGGQGSLNPSHAGGMWF